MRIPTFTQLETPRLRLRHFAPSDLTAFLAYRNDPEVARYQSWQLLTEAEAHTFIVEQSALQPGVPGEGFQFAVALRQTNELVGDCYLLVDSLEPRQAEIGYSFARQYQRQGLATEAVTALLHYLFITLRLHRVTAVADCRNARSIALLEKLGLRREAHFIESYWLKGEWTSEFLYAILAHEWRAS